eukprot:bmy_09444T0
MPCTSHRRAGGSEGGGVRTRLDPLVHREAAFPPVFVKEDQALPLPRPQEGSYRRKDLKSLEDWQNLTFKYWEKIQQRKKSEIQEGEWVPQGSRGIKRRRGPRGKQGGRREGRGPADSPLPAEAFVWRGKEGRDRGGAAAAESRPAGGLSPRGRHRSGGLSPGALLPADHGPRLPHELGHEALGVPLPLEDDALCAPNFISHVQRKVDTLGSQPWALLEFSNLGFLGKLFRSGDLPVRAHFLLLFYREKPLARLFPHFRTLLDQKDPILCQPFLFYHRVSYHAPNNSQKSPGTQKKSPYAPDNPPGAVFTDMKVFEVHFPWEAYTLDESFFWTHNGSAGNHLTVILNHPADPRRVQVLTGTIVDGKHALEKGQVELGYEP